MKVAKGSAPPPGLTDAERRQVQFYLNAARGFNDGHGLIVTPAMAKELEAAGLSDGYTVQGFIPRPTAKDT